METTKKRQSERIGIPEVGRGATVTQKKDKQACKLPTSLKAKGFPCSQSYEKRTQTI